jgi:4-amino-4-deoxy-L-arabinose transferase-like glycosyltransferase
MKQNKSLFVFILITAASLWAYSLLFVPTFDLDESLYRRVAEEMKRNGGWWKPTWDQWPLYHKPPIFFWIIAAISSLIDGVQAPVSLLAARMPSLLASVGILVSLFRFTGSSIAPALFLSAVFPLLTATSVIFDPIQTLFLLPALFIPTRAFLNQRELTIRESFLIGLAMFGASAFKGLNGLVIPSLAFGLHALLHQNRIKTIVRFSIYAFLASLIFTAIYYYFLDLKMGRAFTSEFFLVHHLGRSQGAMESHGGSVFYHPLVILLGGGYLISYLVYQWMRAKPSYRRHCFPITYCLAFIIFFSFSATKLPHYTWPAWPALAVMGSILFTLKDNRQNQPLGRSLGFIAGLPVFVISAAALIVLFAGLLSESIFELTPSQIWVVHEFSNISFLCRLALIGCIGVCVIFQANRSKIVLNPLLFSAFAVLTSSLLSFGIVPTVRAVMVTPYEGIAAELRALNPDPTKCIRHVGPNSPTLSLALGYGLSVNRCEPGNMRYLILPYWKEAECAERKMQKVASSSYLSLCAFVIEGKIQ